VYLLLMNSDGSVKSSSKIAHETGGGPTLADSDRFRYLASLGDLNGDGVTDLAVGARSDDTGGENRGAVHILFLRGADNPTVMLSTNTSTISEPSGTATITAPLSDATTAPVTTRRRRRS
jgi:hypothetical protein